MGLPWRLRIPLSVSIDEAVETQRVVTVSSGLQALDETCFGSLAPTVLDSGLEKEKPARVQIRPLTVLSGVSAAALSAKVLALDTVTDRS